MAYEYQMHGLGFSDPRGTCSEIANGETRCFRAREASAATRNRCRTLDQTCRVGTDSGTMYCCPQFGSVRAPTTAQPTTEQEGGVLAQVSNVIKGAIGLPTSSTSEQAPQMPGATVSGKPTAAGFAEYSQAAARQTAASVEEDVMGPVEDSPARSGGQDAADVQGWIQRYQTHITIASTVIGLFTFVIWLVARKK